MYAIVEIAGQQFKVSEGEKIFVHRQPDAVDAKVKYDKVYLIENENGVQVGKPTVPGAVVEAKVLRNDVRGDKVLVFKKKRRKGYQTLNGHRQDYTQLLIESIKA